MEFLGALIPVLTVFIAVISLIGRAAKAVSKLATPPEHPMGSGQQGSKSDVAIQPRPSQDVLKTVLESVFQVAPGQTRPLPVSPDQTPIQPQPFNVYQPLQGPGGAVGHMAQDDHKHQWGARMGGSLGQEQDDMEGVGLSSRLDPSAERVAITVQPRVAQFVPAAEVVVARSPIQQAIIWSEILGKPRALRHDRRRR